MPRPSKKNEREVIYDRVFTEVYDEDNPLTVEKAMELLGWETETEYAARMLREDGGEKEEGKKKKKTKYEYGDEYDLKDFSGDKGEKVRWANNNANRPFQLSWAKTIAQDLLNGNWRLNGETIIIGRTGRVNSGQHRLIGLILAWQQWKKCHPNHHWRQIWKEPPGLHTIVAYGLPETSDVTRTLDNVKPRTLADVLFADGEHFKTLSTTARLRMCKIADYAVKFLWSRTGHDQKKSFNAFAPRKTHSEALEFIERHEKLRDFVTFIYKRYSENEEGKPSKERWETNNKRLSAGYAAGLMYLMAASATDGDAYRNADPPREGTKKKPIIDWSNEQAAKDFWAELTAEVDSDAMTEVRLAFSDFKTPEIRAETLCVLCKAWNAWVEKREIEEDDVDMSEDVQFDDGIGTMFIAHHATVGGIDLGPPAQKVKGEPDEEEQDEIEEEKVKIREEKEEAKRNGAAKKGGKKKKAVTVPDDDSEEAE
jgi:hypothetical protein